MLAAFEQRKKYGEGIKIVYGLKNMAQESLERVKKAILRECEIRLFECEIVENAL